MKIYKAGRNPGRLIIRLFIFVIVSISSCNYSDIMDSLEEARDRTQYGNWCGPGYSGPGAPVDSLDSHCRDHDLCYDAITYEFEYWECTPGEKADCDKIFADGLKALGSDPAAWAFPPADYAAAEQYRLDAIIIFGSCGELSTQF